MVCFLVILQLFFDAQKIFAAVLRRVVYLPGQFRLKLSGKCSIFDSSGKSLYNFFRENVDAVVRYGQKEGVRHFHGICGISYG